MEEFVEICNQDVKQKYMDVTLQIDKDVPEFINTDAVKIKQVLLNMFNQSVIGQTKGFVKILLGYREGGGLNMNIPHITITLENSKFQIKPKDA
jgi:hypothetical protein